MRLKLNSILVIISTFCFTTSYSLTQPNIVFILADDLGFNDPSFRGSSQIFTPHIDSLAFSGIILNRYYVQPLCTPSRSALMTGKYPIHTGMQHGVLYGAEPRGLPLSEKLLPEYLRELGYSNHIVGKWHLGSFKRAYTPLMRGFDSHVGPWTGHHDYFDHTAMETGMWGLDMRRGFDVAYDLHGKYTTDVITEEAVKIIHQRNVSQPLFLYVPFTAVHSSNPYSPLPAPDDTVAKMRNVSDDFNRQRFAAVFHHLDLSVGEIVKALTKEKMLNNTIIVFSTDNGGPAAGFNLNHASNFPLRGVKNTLWEGGVRGAALVWSPMLKSSQRISNQLMHISDWFPTLIHIAGGDLNKLPASIDGVNMWKTLSDENAKSPRREILINIDNIWGSSSLLRDEWKIVKGTNYDGQWDNWYGPEGERNATKYPINKLLSCPTAMALKQLDMMPTKDEILQLRESALIKCPDSVIKKCDPRSSPCLFNVLDDPCEKENLANENPALVRQMLQRLHEFNSTAVPATNLPVDERGDPKFWGYTFTNFGDFM